MAAVDEADDRAISRPKLRSRKDGAAVALDDLDRRLLNLMQGSFPIAPRPYAARRRAGGDRRGRRCMARVQRLLDERIIRQVTPIFDTRALGYSLDAGGGQGRPRAPAAGGATSSTSTPASRTTTCATTSSTSGSRSPPSPTRSSGSSGTLDVLGRLAGAESIRQLPTLKLFKIRMDLEMEGGTEALATGRRGGRAGARPSRQPYDELDVAVIRALQGDMPVVPEPYAPAARRARDRPGRSCSSTSQGCSERGCCAASRRSCFHRRAGFSRQRDGRVEGARRADRGARAADGVVPRASRTATSGPPTRTGPTRSSRWRTAARRRSATRSSTRSPPRPASSERATLYSSTEFKKIRLLYFTDDYRGWEREHAGVLSAHSAQRRARPSSTTARSSCCPAASTRPFARCARSAATRSSSPAARARELIDVDGNEYVDWVCSWGPLILGHAHPAVVGGGQPAAARGAPASARRPRARSSWPPRSPAASRRVRDGAHDLIGHRGDDERAAPGPRGHRARAGRSSSPAPTTATSTGCWPRPARGSPRRGSRPARACPGRRRGRHDRRALERPRGARRGDRAHRPGGDHRRAGPGQHGRRAARRPASSSCCASAPTSAARCWSSTR